MPAVAFTLCVAALAASAAPAPARLAMPGGGAGIGFDDLGFSPAIDKIMVPAGRTGTLDLIDPRTRQIERIAGFASTLAFGGGHGEGITSVDEGRGLLFVTDRTTRRLYLIDARRHAVVSYTPLASGPDYVRFAAATNELWVTQPRAQRIEVFSLAATGAPRAVHAGFIAVPGGPESLVIDGDRAYTNTFRGVTLAIAVKERSVAARWRNGCQGSRGLALDRRRGFLFAGCAEGKLTVMDRNTGKLLDSAQSGTGVDIIAYNSELGHAYLPGATSATMAIVAISATGKTAVLATVATAPDAHCAVSDDLNQVYVCDPVAGSLLIYRDWLPAAR